MSSKILAKLDQLVASHSILQHPFYQAWSAGQLRVEDLAVYSWVYYPHVEAFPAYLETAKAKTSDPSVLQILQENYDEEIGVGYTYSHPELWLHFAKGLGVDRQEVLGALPIPEVQRGVETFRSLCSQSGVSALAALYAYESQQPEVACQKIKGLRQFYQIHDAQTLAYFEVHKDADVRHRAEEREALHRCLEQGASPDEIFQAAQAALDAHWGFLDGVCRQAGLAC